MSNPYPGNYYVYLHCLNGIPFYVGSSAIRLYKDGGFRTHHERAYIRGKRNDAWKTFVGNKKIQIEIIGYFNSVEDVLCAEYDLIHKLLKDGYTLTNILGAKPIFQFTTEGIFIKEWKSILEASEDLNIDSGSISSIITGGNNFRHSAGGFLWSLTNTCPFVKKFQKKIIQKSLDGAVLNSFLNVAEARRHMRVNSDTAIRECIKGKYSHAYGYKWEMIEQNPIESLEKGYSVSKHIKWNQ